MVVRPPHLERETVQELGVTVHRGAVDEKPKQEGLASYDSSAYIHICR